MNNLRIFIQNNTVYAIFTSINIRGLGFICEYRENLYTTNISTYTCMVVYSIIQDSPKFLQNSILRLPIGLCVFNTTH